MIFNVSSVLRARLRGRKRGTGGAVSGLFLEERAAGQGERVWRTLLTAGGRLRPGLVVDLVNEKGEGAEVALELLECEGDGWLVRVDAKEDEDIDAASILERVGATPLPPYILGARRQEKEFTPDELDRSWYQTVYADLSRAGSVAAPTAGLHFTPELLESLSRRGALRRDVALHVGEGTFKPVEAEHVEEHDMHEEWFFAPPETINTLAERTGEASVQRTEGGSIVCVGTTSARAVESIPLPVPLEALERGVAGRTRLLITPGHEWRYVDALMTNFHLPRSTLLAMVAALLPEGVERLLDLYREAIAMEYRFYSYGDAMLVAP